MDSIRFKSSHGIVLGYEGECCSLTFAKKDNVHTPVMRGGLSKTITTMCDHDIGVIVKDERENRD